MLHNTPAPTLNPTASTQPSPYLPDPGTAGQISNSDSSSPQPEHTPPNELTLEEWASKFNTTDASSSPPRHENQLPSSLTPPSPHNARARKKSSAKKRRHNGVKGEKCDGWFELRYEADHGVNLGR